MYKAILTLILCYLLIGCPVRNLPPPSVQHINLETEADIKPEPFLPEAILKYNFNLDNYKELYHHINDIALQHDIDPDLIRSVIIVESKFNISAKSKKGAKGLMQLVHKTALSVGCQDRLDPIENLSGGTLYLSQMLERFDDNLKVSLAAYNAGPTAVARYGGVPPYKETQKYVKTVLEIYRLLKTERLKRQEV